MEDIEKTADQIEVILRQVIDDADAADPAPERYFMISDLKKDDHWILGFAFETKKDLRSALENGVCFEIHDFVLKALSRSEQLREVESHIVFDFGEAPETREGHQKLHDRFVEQLGVLQHESESGEFVTCGLCGHSVDDHLMKGRPADGAEVPTEGWMVCPNDECTCFRTWSLGGCQG